MSSLWLNIRFGLYHLQAGPGFRFSWSINLYHVGNPVWFQVHDLFGWRWPKDQYTKRRKQSDAQV